jgi:hypothetical protein
MVMRSRMLVGLAVTAVLVAGCAIFYSRVADRMPDLNYRTLAATGEEGRAAKDGLALADLGPTPGYTDFLTFDQVVGMNVLAPEELAVFRDGVPAAARVAVVTLPQGRLIAIAVNTASPQAAHDTVAKLNQLQLVFELAPVPAPTGVLRVEHRPAQGKAGPTTERAHYAHGPVVVRMELVTKAGTVSGDTFTGLLDRQLRELPAHG